MSPCRVAELPEAGMTVYVGEFEARKSNDVGERLSAAFSRVL
jgi:hypothetical protein